MVEIKREPEQPSYGELFQKLQQETFQVLDIELKNADIIDFSDIREFCSFLFTNPRVKIGFRALSGNPFGVHAWTYAFKIDEWGFWATHTWKFDTPHGLGE